MGGLGHYRQSDEVAAALGTIHVTDRARARLSSWFQFEDRGVLVVKGKAPMRTFFLPGPAHPRSKQRMGMSRD